MTRSLLSKDSISILLLKQNLPTTPSTAITSTLMTLWHSLRKFKTRYRMCVSVWTLPPSSQRSSATVCAVKERSRKTMLTILMTLQLRRTDVTTTSLMVILTVYHSPTASWYYEGVMKYTTVICGMKSTFSEIMTSPSVCRRFRSAVNGRSVWDIQRLSQEVSLRSTWIIFHKVYLWICRKT